jgi:tetratricopeptide (TPR) repeat protein
LVNIRRLDEMLKKIPVKSNLFFLLGFLFIPINFAYAQGNEAIKYNNSFRNGTMFYTESRWQEAAAEFRSAQESAKDEKDWSEALYWVIMSELSAADYGSALRDMDELEKSESPRGIDISYHRGRAYFYLGYFEDALLQFKQYNDSSNDEMRKAAAYFWMGECLFSIGQFDKASEFYSWVITKYPASSRVDVSSYRLDIIRQKKIEAELLMLLKQSHEESLKNSSDYQQKIKIYESTLIAYQKQLADQNNRIHDTDIMKQEEMPVTPQQIIHVPGGNTLERARQLRNEVQWGIETLERMNGGIN